MKYIIPYYLFLNEASSKEIIDHWKSKIPTKILDTFKRIVDNNVQFLDKICSLYDSGTDSDELLNPFGSITNAKKLQDPLANKIKPDDIQNLTNLISLAKPLMNKDYYFSANTNKYKNYDGGKLTYKKLQDDDKVLLVSYHSTSDCVYFGDRRGWCTGDTTKGMFDKGSYARDYLRNGDIYFIVDKKKYNEDPNDMAACMQLSIKFDGKYEFKGQRNMYLTKDSAVFKPYLTKLGVDMGKIPLPDDLLDVSKFHPQLHPFLDLLPLNNRQKSNLSITPDGKKIIIDTPITIDFLDMDCDAKTFLDNTQFSKITLDLQHSTTKKTELYKKLIDKNVKIEFINNNIENFDIYGTDIKTIDDIIFIDDISKNKFIVFTCHNTSITTLKGSPKNFYGTFTCSYNTKLESLEGAPEHFKGAFICLDNDNLKTLKNGIRSVNGYYTVNGCFSLSTLEGGPEYVELDFSCSNNQLTSIKGAPNFVGQDFDCSTNALTSLNGAPNRIFNDFSCSFNNLTSLKGAPETVGGNFDCQCNKLTSLDGIPKNIGGDFHIDKSCGFSEEYIRSLSNIKGKVYFV